MKASYICQCLLQVMEPITAEYHHNYLDAQIRMSKHGYSCKTFCVRMLQMNEYYNYLPCLQDEEGSSQVMKHADVPFSNIEMSMSMLGAVPSTLSSDYCGGEEGWTLPDKHQGCYKKNSYSSSLSTHIL